VHNAVVWYVDTTGKRDTFVIVYGKPHGELVTAELQRKDLYPVFILHASPAGTCNPSDYMCKDCMVYAKAGDFDQRYYPAVVMKDLHAKKVGKNQNKVFVQFFLFPKFSVKNKGVHESLIQPMFRGGPSVLDAKRKPAYATNATNSNLITSVANMDSNTLREFHQNLRKVQKTYGDRVYGDGIRTVQIVPGKDGKEKLVSLPGWSDITKLKCTSKEFTRHPLLYAQYHKQDGSYATGFLSANSIKKSELVRWSEFDGVGALTFSADDIGE